MTALLTDNLPLLVSAPNGIKKLRELILELAVRGKLVPQDPSDAPASELLKRIAEAKAQLVIDGKIKKQKQQHEVNTDEIPFELPAGWVWQRLGAVANIFNGNSISSTEKESKFTGVAGRPYIATKDVGYGLAQLDYENGIRIPEDELGFRIAHAGAVLLCAEGGSAGKKCGITNRDICFGNKLFATEIYGSLPPKLVLYYFLTPTFRAAFGAVMTGIIGGVSIAKFVDLPIPIPPLVEQHRIVSKVDELMALCDRLEDQQADAESAHAQLVQALLDSLAQASDATDFAANWQRLAEHFHTLFTTEPSIDALKQTLLQLAVMGKLVPQDPGDEPANRLLKNIQLEKKAVIVERKKLDKLRHFDTDDEFPFKLPSQWEWARLGETAISGPSNGISPKPAPVETPYRCLTLSATTRGTFNNQCFKFVDIDADTASKFFLKEGDLLIQRANSIDYVGVSAIYDGPDDQFIFPDLMMRLRISDYLSRSFVHAYLSSMMGRSYFRNHASGTQGNMPKINQGTVVNAPIPIPPFPEQNRIVAKIDQLMAVCNQLKSRLTEARQLNEQLASTLVEQAVA